MNDTLHATDTDRQRAAPHAAGLAAGGPLRGGIGQRRPGIAATVFDLLDPVPYGFFVAALIFDVIYARSAEVMWFKSAAWLIAIGLLFAIVPRFVNLAHVWFPRGRRRADGPLVPFWLNLLAIVFAVWNAFVHSRDAYGVMPEGLWLSVLTVALLVLAKVMPALQHSNEKALS